MQITKDSMQVYANYILNILKKKNCKIVMWGRGAYT